MEILLIILAVGLAGFAGVMSGKSSIKQRENYERKGIHWCKNELLMTDDNWKKAQLRDAIRIIERKQRNESR